MHASEPPTDGAHAPSGPHAPVAPPAVTAGAPSERVSDTASGSVVGLLVRDADVRRVLARILTRGGLTVHAMTTPGEALALLQQPPATRPAVLVVDLGAAALGNVAFARLARRLDLSVGLVLLSTLATVAPEPIDLGPFGQAWGLAKPIGGEHLLRAVRLAVLDAVARP